MKRIKAACIYQTPGFMLQDDVAHDYAGKQAEQEVEQCKKNLGRTSPVVDYLKKHF